MPLFKLKKKKSRQPSPHPVPPPHIDIASPNTGRELSPVANVSGGEPRSVNAETDEVVLTIFAGQNDTRGSPSQNVLQESSRSQRSHEDGGPVERDGGQGIPLDIPDPKHIVPNVPGLSVERESNLPNLPKHDQQ